MRAVVVDRFGGPEVLELAELPIPEPGPGQVRIRVRAAAVNPVDIATRAGWLADGGLMRAGRAALGWDAAGVVDTVGPAPDGTAARFAPGDRVIAMRHLLGAPVGAQAEFVVLDDGAVAPAPDGLSDAAAATLALNGLTADQALDLIGLPAGRSLLVTGAAGAVGGYALQLAALRGVRTVAVAGTADEPLVSELGAGAFVSRDDDLAAAVRWLVPGGVDAVLDAATVGIPALDAVRDGGAFVSVVAGSAPPPLRGIDVRTVYIRSDAARLAALSALTAAGRLTPRVAITRPLAEVAAAHEAFEAGGVRGRIVLEP